jgi:hypothetical protein
MERKAFILMANFGWHHPALKAAGSRSITEVVFMSIIQTHYNEDQKSLLFMLDGYIYRFSINTNILKEVLNINFLFIPLLQDKNIKI